VSIDIGFGDIIYPERMKMEFPVLLDMEVPEVYAYSLYSVIAEKFEAFVSLGLANGRYKDFYDIYVLADRYNLDGAELKKAIIETFTHRETGFTKLPA
jgi:predicted nucleotidyltransferase component of viral defense system